MTDGHELVVYLGSDAVAAQEGVDVEGKVECRGAHRHGLYLALWCEDDYLRAEEVELYGVEEVHGIGLWVVEYLLYGAQPVLELGFFLAQHDGVVVVAVVLVFPVGGKSLLGNLVHALRTYLHLDPLARLRHERDVQSHVAVGLGLCHPVAEAVGVAGVELAESNVDVEAVAGFAFRRAWLEDDADGQDVVDFVESEVLRLHFRPDGVGTFDPRLYLVAQSFLVEYLAYGLREVVEEGLALRLCLCELALDEVVGVGIFELEAQVFELVLNLVQAEAVGYRGVDVERFACNLHLLVVGLRCQRAHIVEPVAYLDEDYAYVVVHRQQQLLEVFGLRRRVFAEDAAADLGQSVDYLGYLLAKEVFYVLCGVVGVFHYIMQQGGADAR